MATEIPDLWPAYVEASILSPLAILRVQATRLRDRTGGLLEATVHQGVEAGVDGQPARSVLRFEINAPAIDYRRELFTCSHVLDCVYPATLDSELLEVKPPTFRRELYASDQAELYKAISQLFTSPGVSAVISSMIAQSNDATGVAVR